MSQHPMSTKNTRFHYAWVIVAIAALAYFFSGPGQTYFFSLFIDEYIEAFGWSRSAVSNLYSVATLVSGLLMFGVGRLSDRIGKKKLILVAGVLLALVCLWNSLIVNLFMLVIGFFGGRFSGQGSMTLLSSTLLPRWFNKKRGLAMSLMAMGGVIGGAAVPPINAFLIQVWGWQWAWRFWALLLIGFFVPIVFFFLRDDPSDLGLEPYDKDEKKKKTLLADATNVSIPLFQAMRHVSFWAVVYCQILFPLVGTGVVFHLVSIVGHKGMAATDAAFILSIAAAIGFLSTILAGYFLDKIPVRFVIAIMLVAQLMGLLALNMASTMWMAVLFGVFQGIATGLNMVAFSYLWPAYYGTEHLGSIRGLTMSAVVIGSALGPIPFGYIYDRIGDYTIAFYIMMTMTIVGIAASFFCKKPKIKRTCHESLSDDNVT